MNLSREMTEVPQNERPFMPSLESIPLNVWMSIDYMAVLYLQKADGLLRLTVNKTKKNGKDWRDGITWDELQRIKNECLGSDVWCVENYPSEDCLVNVCNQRHLFVLDEKPRHRFPEKAVVNDDEVNDILNILKGRNNDRHEIDREA